MPNHHHLVLYYNSRGGCMWHTKRELCCSCRDVATYYTLIQGQRILQQVRELYVSGTKQREMSAQHREHQKKRGVESLQLIYIKEHKNKFLNVDHGR